MARTKSIPRARGQATAAAYAVAAAAREPVLWPRAHSFARQWRALSRWPHDVSALGDAVPWAMARLDESGGGEFVLTAPQRGGSGALLQSAPAWEPLRASTRNVSVSEILQSPAAAASKTAAAAGGGRHFYYSGSLHGDAATAHWHTEDLVDDLSPLDAIALKDVPALAREEPIQPPPRTDASTLPTNRTVLRLWLTSGGVLARTHYDKSHNVLCVVQGSKQLVLWPPSELPSLHLYPAVHAAHRQSQVSSLRLGSLHAAVDASAAVDSAPASAVFSLKGVVGEFALVDAHALLGARGAKSAVLGAGDCLYIPPYWAHLVYSPSPSVALAAFSTSWEQARWARSAWLAAPLGRFEAAGLCSKARGAALLLSAFVHACVPLLAADGHTPRRFLAALFVSRYAPLYGSLHDDTSLGAAVGEHSSSASLAECLAATDAHPLPPDAPERDPDLRRRLRAFGVRMAAILTETDLATGRRYERGVALELAADYVEEVAGWACGAAGAWRLLRLLARTAETDVGHASGAPAGGGANVNGSSSSGNAPSSSRSPSS